MESIYNGSLTREKFLFYEIRIVAKLLCDGLSPKDAVLRIQQENLFQFPTEKMITRIAKTCFTRIDALDSKALIYALANEPVDTAKQINLYAMMKYNRLVWDFMTTVVGEKYRTQDFILTQRDMNTFINGLIEQNDEVASWSVSTIKKIKQILIRMLFECDYIDSIREERLNLVMISPELEDAIKEKGDFAALPAFNCFD